jgi:uncharacterized protein (TIGR03790 family)
VDVSVSRAVAPTTTLLLYNVNDPDSVAIRDHYLVVHPGVRSLGLNLNGLGEEIGAQVYLDQIRTPVYQSLTMKKWGDGIDTIVTTKGLPLRIDAGAAPAGALDWRRFSSLESELTRLDTIDSIDEMGNQAWDLAGINIPNILPANPYYLGLEFDLQLNQHPYDGPQAYHRSDPINEGIRLTSRLDAFSRDDVIAMIDRSQSVYVVPHSHYIAVDNDPDAVAASSTRMVELAENILPAQGQLAGYNNTNDAITMSYGADVIGYVSHGTNDGPGGLAPGYITDQLEFELARGAVFHSYESYNACSFDPDETQNQGRVGEWIAIGGTAALGHVAEPFAGQWTVTNEDIFFDMLLSGYSLVESAWAATRQLSYVNTVIGDPLMRYQTRVPGDINLDGVVDTADYLYWVNNRDEDGNYSLADLSGDNVVNGVDYLIWAEVYEPGASSASASTGAVPEPTTSFLFVLGGVCLWALQRRRR